MHKGTLYGSDSQPACPLCWWSVCPILLVISVLPYAGGQYAPLTLVGSVPSFTGGQCAPYQDYGRVHSVLRCAMPFFLKCKLPMSVYCTTKNSTGIK